MRILVDNNVVIDALTNRDIYSGTAKKIFDYAGEGRYDAYITANSASDIYYVVRRLTSREIAQTAFEHLFALFKIVTVSGEDCRKAFESSTEDFEDALIILCAEKIDADYLVTRDEKLLSDMTFPRTVHPNDFVAKFEKVASGNLVHEP
jgi:predicted nucleic acid-binding protein